VSYPYRIRAEGRAEGERRRDEALDLIRRRRASVVRAAQRALLSKLLDADTATADDVRDLVPLPSGIDPKVFGAAPTPLADAGLIRAAGFKRSCRPKAHARPVTVWALADRAAARLWLAAHPELPTPDADGDPAQLTLWH
jgi:hypothetical protein